MIEEEKKRSESSYEDDDGDNWEQLSDCSAEVPSEHGDDDAADIHASAYDERKYNESYKQAGLLQIQKRHSGKIKQAQQPK